jgi:hypothetical protein
MTAMSGPVVASTPNARFQMAWPMRLVQVDAPGEQEHADERLGDTGEHGCRHGDAPRLAALDPEEQKQLNDMLRRMMKVVDRPGLLKTPESVASQDTAATSKSRFTPAAGPE